MKIKVWLRIQRDRYSDSIAEVITRFAALAFAEAAVRNNPEPPDRSASA